MNPKTFLRRLDQLATTRNTWLAFAPFAAVGSWLMLADARLQRLAPGLPKLDFRIHGYTAADVERLLSAYGPSGRAEYGQQTVVDTLFPVLVAAFGLLFFARTFRRWGWSGLGNMLILGCVLFLVVDLAENACIFAMLKHYPHPADGLIAAGSVLTQVKLPVLLSIYFFVVLNACVLSGKLLTSWWQALGTIRSMQSAGNDPRL
ncbi:hypothetical protein F0P96_01345 [Hymenobacter busanensis]|uniref:Uncharacterized protein n=1 Tax=Hymenobacter busanensis TaxID=2607656 RepID=A0A7L4ZU16_9BACT|nr:hypothetical protein [Hymenobacter busanensis]KAA9339299.1 hypothetical protein F0P96_01345 [Hymenobacter busanensis]QHJ06939.1 hypothetical protein GUY19_06405 [Hymenobacter busanensis]